MATARRFERMGSWPADRAVATVTLDFDLRSRRRIALTCDDGGALLVDLPRAAGLRAGDGLALEDGGWVAVRAADEDIAEIACADAEQLARVAWHLGNRHLPVQVLPGRLRIRYDHVIVGMASGLGAAATRLRAPFEPEAGAYAGGVHDHGEHTHAHPPTGTE
jgi:urease accessory protein